MLTPSVPQFRRPRAKTSRLGALTIIGTKDLSGGEDDLTFTAVLNTSQAVPLAGVGTADALKWVARFGGGRFIGNTLTLLSPTSILVEMVVDGAEAGPNAVSYSAAPSDIADVLGRKLAAFSGFPL